MASTSTRQAPVERFQLGGAWFAYAGCFAIFTWLCSSLGGAPVDLVLELMAGMALLGVGLGLYERYRSLFGVTTWLVRMMLGGLLFGVLAPVTAMMGMDVIALGSPVSPAALGLAVGAVMLGVLGAGAAKGRAVVRAQAGDAEPAWLRARVDLARNRLLDITDAATSVRPTRRTNIALMLLALAINLPLLFTSPDRVRGLMLLVVAPLVCVAAGQVAYAVGQTIAYLLEIGRRARTEGRVIVSAQREQLQALRRRFWLRRVLCRPEDR